MSNGETLSSRVEARVEQFVDDLEAYSASLGLPAPEPRAIDHYLNMSRSELEALDADALGVIAAEVSSYAYYLKDQVNRKQAVVDKCTHEIVKNATPRASRYDAFKHEDKLMMAILDDAVTKSLHDLRFHAQSHVTRWQYLASQLADYANKLEALHYTRRKNAQGSH